MALNKDLVERQLGPEAKLGLQIVDSVVKFTLTYDGKVGGGAVSAYLPMKEFGEMLKELIPGKIDDMLIDAAESIEGV